MPCYPEPIAHKMLDGGQDRQPYLDTWFLTKFPMVLRVCPSQEGNGPPKIEDSMP